MRVSARRKGAPCAVRSASARRSALRADSPAVLGHVARRGTRSVRCAHCARTAATSQTTKRAARAATRPAFLGASQGALRTAQGAPLRTRHGSATKSMPPLSAKAGRRSKSGAALRLAACGLRPRHSTAYRVQLRHAGVLVACHHGVLAAGGIRRGRFVGRREAQERGRRAQRASWSDSPRLFERSERSERSEFRGATPLRDGMDASPFLPSPQRRFGRAAGKGASRRTASSAKVGCCDAPT